MTGPDIAASVMLEIVDEFDTGAERNEWSIVRVVFDPARRNYRVGYDSGHAGGTAFEGWTSLHWGQPLTAKQAHRRVRSHDTRLRCFMYKMACANAIEAHAKQRSLW
jgi:hypothetical protein